MCLMCLTLTTFRKQSIMCVCWHRQVLGKRLTLIPVAEREIADDEDLQWIKKHGIFKL